MFPGPTGVWSVTVSILWTQSILLLSVWSRLPVSSSSSSSGSSGAFAPHSHAPRLEQRSRGGGGVAPAALCPLPPASSACAAAPASNWGSRSGGEPQICRGAPVRREPKTKHLWRLLLGQSSPGKVKACGQATSLQTDSGRRIRIDR